MQSANYETCSISFIEHYNFQSFDDSSNENKLYPKNTEEIMASGRKRFHSCTKHKHAYPTRPHPYQISTKNLNKASEMGCTTVYLQTNGGTGRSIDAQLITISPTPLQLGDEKTLFYKTEYRQSKVMWCLKNRLKVTIISSGLQFTHFIYIYAIKPS